MIFVRGSIAIRAVLCGRYFFLVIHFKKFTNMDYKQAARSHEFNKKHGSISSLINKSTIDSFEAGYEFCKKEYEERLRWIPVEEKLPESHCFLVAKKKNGLVLGLYFSSDKEFRYGEFDQTDQVTHWRFIL